MKSGKLGFTSLVMSAAVFCAAAAPQLALATPVVYGFESFNDLDMVTSLVGGLTFSNTTVIQAGASLNEFEFPPRSGMNVVFDNGGPITIDFASPVFSVGGYFNYVAGLSFSAYDSANGLLGTDVSDFAINTALSGDVGSTPNEFLNFSSASGLIARVVITGGDPLGASFTLDDLTVDAGTAIPEPQTLALVLGLLGAGCLPGGWIRRRAR